MLKKSENGLKNQTATISSKSEEDREGDKLSGKSNGH